LPYTLYYSPGTASFAVHWMLIEIGVPFETVKVDLAAKVQKTPEFLKLNLGGHVPALVIDGVPHAETAALLMLLAERHPQARLAPEPGSPDRANYLQWMIVLANTLQPAFRLWFYSEEGAGAGNEEATRAQARIRIEAIWDRLEQLLADGRGHMLGTQISATDFLATMLMRWSRGMPRPANDWPNIATYIARMKSRPSLRTVHEREALTDWS
jgi:glutathione S-transferase